MEIKNPKEFFAILIGVNSYKSLSLDNLPTSACDVQALEHILTDPLQCGYPDKNTHILIGEDANKHSIITAIKKLSQSTNLNSTIFIYFSGHGAQVKVDNTWHAYLCPVETDITNIDKTAIKDEELSNLIASIPAKKLIIILDCCHAAGTVTLKGGENQNLKMGLPEAYYEMLSQGSGSIVIASSKTEQFSYVRPQKDLSVFTYHLLQALTGQANIRNDGLIHILDVFHYISEAMQDSEPKQTPILKAKNLDMNFPIAFSPQTQNIHAKNEVSEILEIRDKIISDPLKGTKALYNYLAGSPKWKDKCDEVSLKIATLKRIQHDMDVFGQNDNDKYERNRTIFFLLSLCTLIETNTKCTEQT